jgi:hypothetical protein
VELNNGETTVAKTPFPAQSITNVFEIPTENALDPLAPEVLHPWIFPEV